MLLTCFAIHQSIFIKWARVCFSLSSQPPIYVILSLLLRQSAFCLLSYLMHRHISHCTLYRAGTIVSSWWYQWLLHWTLFVIVGTHEECLDAIVSLWTLFVWHKLLYWSHDRINIPVLGIWSSCFTLLIIHWWLHQNGFNIEMFFVLTEFVFDR